MEKLEEGETDIRLSFFKELMHMKTDACRKWDGRIKLQKVRSTCNVRADMIDKIPPCSRALCTNAVTNLLTFLQQ